MLSAGRESVWSGERSARLLAKLTRAISGETMEGMGAGNLMSYKFLFTHTTHVQIGLYAQVALSLYVLFHSLTSLS
jgi:hypothetical protein